jgi:hypothetical protein
MIENTEVLNKLRELKPVLREKYGIEAFALLGSQARNDYVPISSTVRRAFMWRHLKFESKRERNIKVQQLHVVGVVISSYLQS